MKIYYDDDASLSFAKEKKIAIVGYGNIGRASALNLRDSGFNVIIGNARDNYFKLAKKDNFVTKDIAEAVVGVDIIFLLLPDQVQKIVYEKYIEKRLRENVMLIVAHGFSINYRTIVPPKNIDVCLLAPRMPGGPIRDYYLTGGGVPAFATVHQDASGSAKNVLLSLAKAIGYTKAGVMDISIKEETEIDLFIEQYLLPTMVRAIRLSFDELVKAGYTPESTLMELYASGEIGELFMIASRDGIYETWRDNASPTCQYGIFRSSKYIFPEKEAKRRIKKVLKEIKDGSFVKDLAEEEKVGYKNLKAYDEKNKKSKLTKTQQRLARLIKYRHE